MAVQLAFGGGARVIATAGEAEHDLLRSLGAEPVAYGDGLLERVQALAPDGVDAALDCVGTAEAIEVSLAVVGIAAGLSRSSPRLAPSNLISRGSAEGRAPTRAPRSAPPRASSFFVESKRALSA